MRFTVTRMTCPLKSRVTKNLQSIVQPKDFNCAVKMQLPVHASSNTRQRDDLFFLEAKNRPLRRPVKRSKRRLRGGPACCGIIIARREFAR